MGNVCPCCEEERSRVARPRSNNSNSGSNRPKQPKSMDRLNSEFAFLRSLVKLNQKQDYHKLMSTTKEYYSNKQNCSS